jgi:hypothetical protein
MNNFQLSKAFETGLTDNPLDEFLSLAAQISNDIDLKFLKKTHEDIALIFAGNYPGYRINHNKYHDLRHTHSVVLATIRLFHGLHCDGLQLPVKTVQKSILSAYFHDSGLLLRDNDTAESGANYTKYHEDRSIQCLQNYLQDLGRSEDFCHECANIIRFTNINLDPRTLPNLHHSVILAGNVLGTADILAQMADRYYLESLPLLFEEHLAGGILDNKSACELIRNTADFYKTVVRERLHVIFGDVGKSMRSHFKNRFQINSDLYIVNIEKNIEYLRSLLKKNEGETDTIRIKLRRIPPQP